MNKVKKYSFMVMSSLLASLLILQIAFAAYPTPPSLESEIMLDGGYGFGSSGTYVRRFQNVDINVGTDITYTDDSVYGDSFTVNTNGLYSINYTDWRRDGGYDSVGLSVNSTPTSPLPYGASELCLASTYVTQQMNCSATVYLNSGDVIRPHWGGGGFAYPQPYGADVVSRFIIVKVK
jgi:hypothetical protein